MTADLIFRALQQEEAALVAQLQQAVMPNPWSTRQFTESIEAGHLCLLAVGEDQILACAVVRSVAGEAELLTVATARDSQEQGLATRLLGELFRRLAAAGVKRCLLEVRADNTAAIALYRHFGFVEVGRRQNYYTLPEGRVDALVMRTCAGDVSHETD